MIPHVLGVGFSYDEYRMTASVWEKYGIEFDYADSIKQATAMLTFKEYICVAICTDVIPQEDLNTMRETRPVPSGTSSPITTRQSLRNLCLKRCRPASSVSLSPTKRSGIIR